MSEFDDRLFTCEDAEPRLQDFVDGHLGAVEERRMRAHLAGCQGCRREERELRQLLTRVAELPRRIEPPHDLWPGVAERLGERPAGPAELGDASRMHAARTLAGPWTRWTPRQWLLQAAAAVVFMVAGAGLSQLLSSPTPESQTSARGEGSPAAVAASLELDAVEAEYLRAKDALWLLVYSRREEVPPVKLEIVQRNLEIIDGAIRELREALAEDPGNLRLEHHLLAQHRRSIELLQRLAETSPAWRASSAAAHG